MMQITVIGSQGQLGQDLMLSLAAEEHQLTGLTHQQISIEDVASIETALEANAPDLIQVMLKLQFFLSPESGKIFFQGFYKTNR